MTSAQVPCRPILHNRRYTGRQERGEGSISEYLPKGETEIKEKAHKAIIPLSVWKKAQENLGSPGTGSQAPRGRVLREKIPPEPVQP